MLIFRKPNHPALKYWRIPKETKLALPEVINSSAVKDCTENMALFSGGDVSGSESISCGVERTATSVINGHTEPEIRNHNSLKKVKLQKLSSPFPLTDTGDSNNNLHDSKESMSNCTSISTSVSSTSCGDRVSHVVGGETSAEKIKSDHEPLSPVPALVSVEDQVTHKDTSAAASERQNPSQLPVKSEARDGQTTEQTCPRGFVAGLPLEAHVSLKQSRPQFESETLPRSEDESGTWMESVEATTSSDSREEIDQASPSRMSEDEGLGAMNNLLDDITFMQDDLETRVNDIEEQLAGKHHNY